MDLQILAALAERSRFKNLRAMVPDQMINPDTAVMLQWYNAYFEAFPDQKVINHDQLTSLIGLRSKNASPEAKAITLHLVDRLRKGVPADVVQGIVAQLYELDFVGQAGAVLARYEDGQPVEASYELQMLATKVRRAMTESAKASWADGDILDYLAADKDEGGLQWTSFRTLELSLKGLTKGKNVALAAPTDKGKTSMLCRVAVDFQKQAKILYPGQPTVYLVNEGTQESIKNRLYGTVAGVERDVLWDMAKSGALQKLYADELGGDDMIRPINIHGKNMAQISRIIEQHNPHFVISDMTGRIRATSNKSGGANDINQLEEVWNDMRELAVIHDFAHMGTVQVSAEGFGMLFPPVSAMQNSKTGIQTTLDLIIMLGAQLSPDAADLRGISTPKNKLARAGCKSLNMFQAHFEAATNTWSEYAS
ncbi:MAG: hypothetical protein [Bacteriophage sp.]|nr:MAG: hypothetical protein [Bacteriophage sp.]